mmetsp:Transcript_2252/g.5124  ORF Transcript_2252/g.5124 Transcript_2252/m.5124 type:complete len:355 (+) Transcript_2252:178-1242(+)|eukprot:CAMPEP_0113477304 /NCGR_PEP_ID=MMETSP0014_2-20120614/20136_1 /TAXON_ID=2857 /ORGANISM="Nitzschia sp." /LENGTH=354 /DNA_ID=CAMNT_0000370389 /DNA_START=70 /DNA_END=1134 /DNA_ORIENTATION=+ /assembly_acc=CAM_ASM_000159
MMMMTATDTHSQLPNYSLTTHQEHQLKMDRSSVLFADGSATSGMTGAGGRTATQPRSRTNNTNQQKRLKRPPVFPLQLYDVLTDAEKDPVLQAIVSWLPDGKSFLVHNEKNMDVVLKRYFKGIKISSFTRQLQIYGFARYKGVCTHVLLQRGQRHLLRNKSLDDFQSLSLNKKDNRGGRTTSRRSTPSAATSIAPQDVTGMSTAAAHAAMPMPTPVSTMIQQDRQNRQYQQQEFGPISPAVVSQSTTNSLSASSSSLSSSSSDGVNEKWDDLSWLSDIVDLEPLPTSTTTNMTTMPTTTTTTANIVDDSSSSRQSRFSQEQGQHIFQPSTSSFDALIESMDLDAQFGDDVGLTN